MKTMFYQPKAATPIPHFNAKQDSTRIFTPQLNQVSVKSVLKAKQLVIMRDPMTGSLRSKDGRKSDPNQQLADALSENYAYLEPLFIRLRQIGATEQCSGLIQTQETGLRKGEILANVQALCSSGLVVRYAEYLDGVYVQLNREASSFLAKEFAQLHLVHYIKQYVHPDEIFYDVHLDEDHMGKADQYVLDIIFRKNTSVNFVAIALNKKLDQMPQLTERLVRTANRLRSSLTVVVSPSVDAKAMAFRLNSMTNGNVSEIKVVPYHRFAGLLP